MKKLIFLLCGISLLFTGCDINETLFPEAKQNLKSAEMKMIPIKGEVQSHVTGTLNSIPVFGILSGNMSHLGKLISDKSTWYTISVEMDEATWIITWKMFGELHAANDDILRYTLTGTFNIPDNVLDGHIDFNGGTGRFCQAQGSMEINGYADDPMNISTMFMQGEGMITNVGSNHNGENILVDQNETIAQALIVAFDTHDTDLLKSLFADEFNYVEVTTGRTYTDKESLAEYINATVAGIPDTRFDLVSIVANSEYAAAEWVWKGTNTVGWPYMGIPPTDKYFELPGVSVMKIENGKIISNNDYWDWNLFMQLLGVAM